MYTYIFLARFITKLCCTSLYTYLHIYTSTYIFTKLCYRYAYMIYNKNICIYIDMYCSITSPSCVVDHVYISIYIHICSYT